MKRLIILIILIKSSFASISQTPSKNVPLQVGEDTICFYVSKASFLAKQSAVNKILTEELGATKVGLSLAQTDIFQKEERLRIKDSVIAAFTAQYQAAVNNIRVSDSMFQSCQRARDLSDGYISSLLSTIKKQKGRGIVSYAVGAIGIIVGGYLAFFR